MQRLGVSCAVRRVYIYIYIHTYIHTSLGAKGLKANLAIPRILSVIRKRAVINSALKCGVLFSVHASGTVELRTLI